MATEVRDTPISSGLWGRFESVREHLFRQYEDVPFEPGSGLDYAQLGARVAAFVTANPAMPRVLQKAHALRIVLTEGRIAVDPEDWFADKVDYVHPEGRDRREGAPGFGGVVKKLSLGWLDEAIAGDLAETSQWLHRAYRVGQATGPKGGLDRGHIAPGWDAVLSVGLNGLIARARESRAALGEQITPEQSAFLEAVVIVYDAAIAFAGRLADLAERKAAELPAERERMRVLAGALRNVPANKPRTLHEALQFHLLLHELIEIEGEYVRSAGQFDRTFLPYYRADVAAGRLTPDQAKELIQFFWMKFYARTQGRQNGKNFCFGGQYPDGSEISNELTYLALEAWSELGTPDPKLSVRFLPTTDERLYRRVADLIRRGQSSVVLMNDPVAVEALVRRGIPIEDARLHLPIGCYEPVVEGKGVGCTMNVTVNLAKPVELALNDGRDPRTGERVGPRTGDPRSFATFDDLMAAYLAQLDAFLSGANRSIAAAERAWPRINPSPFVAGAIDDCLASGRDVGEGGPIYNTVGFVGAGLANAVDSLFALKRAVYDERRFSLAEVLDALAANYEGPAHERLRQYLLNRVAKWGNNDPEVDALARRIADHYCDVVHSFTNGRGGPCCAALFSLTFALEGGHRTGALPDGRKAGESLAPGVGAAYGRDRESATALLGSVLKLDGTRTPNGAVLDVTLHPTATRGEEGLKSLVGLIKAFFAGGGYAIQFNVVDPEMLLAAQREPERYRSLQIRVTGWSVYYTSLTREEQDQYIARIAHER